MRHVTNQVKIVYTGSMPSVKIRRGPRSWTFVNGKPVQVPEDLAGDLLKKPGFERPEDATLTVDRRRPQPGTVVLRRWGALGDLIMFRAACAAFKRARPDLRLVLKCQPMHLEVFGDDPLWDGVWGIGGAPSMRDGSRLMGAGPEINFDRVAEVDHGPEKGGSDRVTLFLEKLMDPKLEVRPEDWEIPIPSPALAYVDGWLQANGLPGDKPLIALQVRGSGPQKTIPMEQLRRLASTMKAKGNIVLIENREDYVWREPGIFSMTGRDAIHAIALLSRCDLAVTADSGALWLAHAALCPVVVFMGPRQASTRTNRHPLGVCGARGVQLNDLIVVNDKLGCPPCFEQAKACDGKFSCIREQKDGILIPAIMNVVAAALKNPPTRVKKPASKPT